MTAQISDQYTYDGREYNLVACTSPIGFDPREYGFSPTAPHTACWRGYWCEYGVQNGILALRTLHIYCDNGVYPALFGVEAADASQSHALEKEYLDIGHVMDFSGSIVLGRDFIRRYYIHMGFQQPWAYRTVIELAFEKGALLKETDHSPYVEGLRKKIDADPGCLDRRRGDIPAFIEDSFSLDARDKAWWI